MRAYSVPGLSATGSATKTIANIIAATTVRPRIFDCVVGSQATPADQAMEVSLKRFTTVGTAGSNPTPLPLDPSDVASTATAGITHSGEPTYTAGGTLLDININQRSTFRWVASPGFEFVCPATASNGIGLQMVAATAAVIEYGNLFFFE